MYELAFMGACTEGAYKNRQSLDKIFADAQSANATDQIFEAKNGEGDHPLHKAALHGNPTCVEWIHEKWTKHGIKLDIDMEDHNGFSPLYLVCFKGFIGQEGLAKFDEKMRQKRIEIVKFLLDKGANVNFRTPKLQMTPLHWAAYQGDAELV